MQIELNNIAKQYNGEWIFKSISLVFLHNKSYWICGSNGSGKSSLLKVLSGYSVPSRGEIVWKKNGETIVKDTVFENISVCAPYTSLFDKHTVNQAIEFHFKFKKAQLNLSISDIVTLCYLQGNESKQVYQLSSGMQQRLKLALAIVSDTSVLLLDEPCSNLDETAIDWYQKTLQKFSENRLIIIASNNKSEEHFICTESLNLNDYK